MNYEITEEDIKYAELAAHKVAPLFQCFQWQWHDVAMFAEEGGYSEIKEQGYTPTVQQIADEFIRLIEDFENNGRLGLETGRLGIKKDEEGYQLYLTL
jgi:hypothetical protein